MTTENAEQAQNDAPADDAAILDPNAPLSDEPAKEEKDEKAKDESEKDESKEQETSEEGDDDKPKRPSGAQRAKRREAALLNELSQRDRELEDLRRRAPTSDGDKDEDKPPKEDDFPNDWFAYQSAKSAYDARQAVRDEFRRKEEGERATKQSEIARERVAAHVERIEDAREVIADFDEVMAEMKGVNVRQDVIDEIMSSDKSALLSYHLAKNPDKLRDLNQMSGRELAREIGRLEGSVRMPAAHKQTKATPPLTSVKGGASGAPDPSKMSYDEYRRWREGKSSKG